MRCTGPIGMQPWVSEVATAISGRQHQPGDAAAAEAVLAGERAPPAGSRSGAKPARRRERRRSPPPHRPPPWSDRGSADRHGPAPARGRDFSIQAACRRGRSEPGSSVAREDAKAVSRQGRGHHHRGRLVEDLARRRADAEPDPADPGADPGVLRQLAQQLRQRPPPQARSRRGSPDSPRPPGRDRRCSAPRGRPGPRPPPPRQSAALTTRPRHARQPARRPPARYGRPARRRRARWGADRPAG